MQRCPRRCFLPLPNPFPFGWSPLPTQDPPSHGQQRSQPGNSWACRAAHACRAELFIYELRFTLAFRLTQIDAANPKWLFALDVDR